MKWDFYKGEIKMNYNKIVKYMKYVLDIFPNGCANYNWEGRGYDAIINDKRLPEEWEIENIIDDCLAEFHYEEDGLGICGCGNPEDTHEVIRQILNIQSDYDNYESVQKKFSDLCNSDMENDNYHGLIQFVLYILNNKGFLEHGGSVGGAWLTEKGKIYLDLLNMAHKISENELIND